MQEKITIEQHEQALSQIKINAINDLLTAEQKRYLSNKGLTASSKEYLQEAESILSAEQKSVLSKQNLDVNGRKYADAIANMAKKNENHVKALENETKEISKQIPLLEESKRVALVNLEIAREENLQAQTGTNVKRQLTAERNLAIQQQRVETITTELNTASKRKEAIQTELNTITSRTNTAAGVTDIATKTAQAASTSILTAITSKCTLAMKALWTSIKENPISWIITTIGLGISAFELFKGKTDEAKTIQGDFQDALKQSSEDLKINMAVLQNTANGTDTHKKALDKINELCKEYNKTLLDESSTLDEQKKKYAELTDAIQRTTAEKIKAKYVEQAMKDLTDKQTSALEDLKNAAQDAQYDTGKTRIITNRNTGDTYDVPIMEASKNIQNASQAVWDEENTMAVEAAEKLKTLSGEAYQKAFNESVVSIMAVVKAGAQASDKEMSGFKGNIVNHLKTLVGASKECYDQTNATTSAIERMARVRLSNQPAQQALTTANSFDDLEGKANDLRTKIEAIKSKKVTIQIDIIGQHILQAQLDNINKVIDQKTHGLNTEEGINERIKQLNDERSKAVVHSKEWYKIDKDIDYLESKLPKNQEKAAKAAESAQNKAEQMQQKRVALQEKETQAELKAEQSRIAIMDDGYEKRKAQLDLQHKQAIADIQKEQNELEKARKSAGKGGLTAKDTGYFNEQRANEETNYNKQVQKLFDGEIEYKKGQYELYWKWVKNMGADVANTQFSKLIQGGSSFKDYLENEIKKLNDKRASGKNLSEGEANNYINLKVQYDEVTGAKTAMDQFKDGLTQAISNAKTLSEKLEAITKAKEKIKNGTSGLVGADEKAKGFLTADEMAIPINEQVQKLVDQYEDYAQQRKEIEKKYNDDIAELTKQRNKAQENGDTTTAKRIANSITVAERKLKTELSKINLDDFQKQVNWVELFDNLDKVSNKSLVALKNKIKAYIQEANKAGNLSPESMKTLMDAYNRLEQKISDLSPIQALRDGMDDYADACEKVKNAQDAYNESLSKNGKDSKETKNAQDALTNAQNDRANALQNIQNATHSLGKQTSEVVNAGKSVIDMLKSFGVDLGEDVNSMIDGLGTMAQGLENIDLTKPFSVISSAATILTGAGKTIMSALSLGGVDFGGQESLEAYKKAEEKYKTYMSVLDQVIDKQKELVSSLSQEDLKNANNSYNLAMSYLQKEADAARSMGNNYLGAGASKGFFGIGSHSSNGVKMRDSISGEAWNLVDAWKAANNITTDLGGRMEGLFSMTADQLESLKTNVPLFWNELDQTIQDYLQKIIDSNDAEKKLIEQRQELLTGVSKDSFSDSILSDLEDIDVKAEDVFSNISEYMRKALINNMYKNQFKKSVDEWYTMWAQAIDPKGTGGEIITPEEQAALDTLKNSIVTGATDAAKKINDQFNTTESQDALEGAVKSMSEETGSLVAGRLNAVAINQGNQLCELKQILQCNIKIVDNTGLSANELKEIHIILKDMNSKNSSLLSRGIS